MQIVLAIENHHALITLSGVFTFESHRDFKEATASALAREGLETIDIDFSAVEYIDSAALGMLLLLNERAGGRKITLINCKGTVKAVLDIANFGKIFEIK